MRGFHMLPVSCLLEVSSCGLGGCKQRASCSDGNQFEMTKITQLGKHRAEFPTAQTEEKPCPAGGTPGGTLLAREPPPRHFNTRIHLPPKAPRDKAQQIFRDLQEDEHRSKMTSGLGAWSTAHAALTGSTPGSHSCPSPCTEGLPPTLH